MGGLGKLRTTREGSLMPRGHYERKPRTPEPVSAPVEADKPVQPTVLVQRRSEDGIRYVEVPEAEWEREQAEMAAPAPEPITLAVPPHDMVAFKVGQWAGSFCRGEHSTSWRSADDGASLEVTLETAHGTSTLKAPAGNWTEADIDAALAAMRRDLRV